MRKNLQHIQLSKATAKADNEHPEHLDFGAGFAPYLRGTDVTMYIRKPWEIKQYNDINAVETGGEGLLSASPQFDTLTAIKSASATALPGKAITDILASTGCNISGYGLQQAGASTETELAYTLAYGLEIIRSGRAAGISVDGIAQHLTFSFSIGMDHFTEIAKMRAARMLWAKLVKQFDPKDEKSMALQIHSQTGSTAAADPFNNVARICSEAAAAAFGGTQSLHTHTYDTATGQPSEQGIRLAHSTQVFLQEESKITKTVDPWGGSHYVESLTNKIIQRAWALIEETEALGGFLKAIEAEIPQQRIIELLP